MKINRQGKSRVLDKDQLDLLIDALPTHKHKMVALVCRRTACRISESIQLRWENVTAGGIQFPKEICKGKLKSRLVPISDDFYQVLQDWKNKCEIAGESINQKDYLFKGRYQNSHLSSSAFQKVLNVAVIESGMIGFSSHGFRRSGLTAASNKNVPLEHIRQISGHSDLGTLQRYLSVSDQQLKAVALAMD